MRFQVGDRVVVKTCCVRSMVGYYGHVTEIAYPAGDVCVCDSDAHRPDQAGIVVQTEGRVEAPGDALVIASGPCTFFEDELEHVD